MITKLAKARENWIFKIILAAVAISFVSLFGVTGYISSASQNKTVIDVNGQKTSQSEFNYRVQKGLNSLRNLFSSDFEITEDMKIALTENIINQITDESVLDQTMLKYQIYFPKMYVQQVIFNQESFQNPLNGQFNPDLFRQALNRANISESEYISMIKRSMMTKLFITDLVSGINAPKVLINAINKMDNQRKSFKYITLSPEKVNIQRNITSDEIDQYYDDFAESYIIPETRSVEVLYISNEDILNKFVLSQENISNYYNQNIEQFNQPEKREVLQMVFLDEASASNAFEALLAEKEFTEVAKTFKAQNAYNPSLDIVEQDELANELSDVAFSLEVNIPKLLKVADTWQIIQIKEIIEPRQLSFDEAKPEIIQQLSDNNLYDAIRSASALIDDEVNYGKSLDEIATNFNTIPVVINKVSENKLIESTNISIQPLTDTLDFNDIVFSYGLDEISSTEEFDNGIAIFKVTSIVDEHLPEIEEIEEELTALWTIQEKAALMQEMIEGIISDAENSNEFIKAAKARNLEVYSSAPISRTETFDTLSNEDVTELFVNSDAIQTFETSSNNFVLVATSQTVNYENDLNEEKLLDIKKRAIKSLTADFEEALLKSYANEFKITIDYNLAGINDL